MRVAIIGSGCSRFGELWEKGFREIYLEAGLKAIEDAGIEGKEINALYVGNMSAGMFLGQEHVAALIADYAGLAELNIPAVRVEAADASGAVAFREAYLAIKSGLFDVVVAAGVEKVTDVSDQSKIVSSAADQEWECFFGANLASLYALIAKIHMKKFGGGEEDLALIAVKNHKNAVNNPIAHYRREISVEDVLSSPYVAEPLKVLDSAPISDGAAALVLASEEFARRVCDDPVFVEACCQASDYLALQSREDLTSMKAVVKASRKAYKRAGIDSKDVDVAELHDVFTIAEIIQYEDLGFCKKGEGYKLIREGITCLNGDIPVNTSGGLKACGHAAGASGIRQIAEIVDQLRGKAGKRQVDAEIGLSLSVGGTGATAVVTVLRR
ncbi:MAG: thiolase domain-containing protein [Archaeoglobaceae archaeon]|nr:thiolase domain-containing protein [Archaeoglobaceae archaeon]MCX8152013.1 thiolase domain-containing protein [Archaeoglobaceae archaeon]MDW8013402.1 thiolase domain-containing protein [Archaeoglobaceae archaeon]